MQIIEDLKNTPIALFMKLINHNKFTFRNKKYKYFIHKRSWATERVIEIPIVLNYINKNKRILEVGNVLSQFVDVWWDVVDKFEIGNGIINEDIIGFKPIEKYDLIISISTLEHIGFNEDVGGGEKPSSIADVSKIIDAIDNLKTCLKTDGIMVTTLPLGYNQEMDEHLDELGFDELYFLKRISRRNLWVEIEKEAVIEPQYGYPFPCANYICVGVMLREYQRRKEKRRENLK